MSKIYIVRVKVKRFVWFHELGNVLKLCNVYELYSQLSTVVKFVSVSDYSHRYVYNYPGDVEIGLLERNGGLEVEIVQARGLTQKPGSKGPPGEQGAATII